MDKPQFLALNIVRKPKRLNAAIEACRGYTNYISVPKVWERIRVGGLLVPDTSYEWQKVRPVVELTGRRRKQS